MRKLPPRTAGAKPITNGIQDLSRLINGLLKVCHPNRWWNHVLDQLPLVVGQIRGICLTPSCNWFVMHNRLP